jgi:signal transduction histidine kinase
LSSDFDGNDGLFCDLTALVCHDINNYLNAIIMQATVLEQSATSEFRAGFSNVVKQARFIDKLVKKLQQHNREKLLRVTVDSNELARSARDALEQRYPEARITLELMEGRSSALGDASTLNKILSLLGWHSVNVASAAKPQIAITTRMDRNRCCLTWRDNGPPVPDADLERIFELLQSRREGSDEISLPVVSLLVRRLRGSISAARASGGGMEFTLELPVE